MVKKNPTTKKKAAAKNILYKVSGQVFNFNNEPIVGQEVPAVDVDLKGAAIYKTASSIQALRANRGFEFLGTTTTNADGYYEIVFTEEMYKRNELANIRKSTSHPASQLPLGAQGDDVARVHRALQALGIDIPVAETANQELGVGTVAILKALQADLKSSHNRNRRRHHRQSH
jgi:hypothetical protein